jgi:cell wall-associated NlpC family hydrolase
MVANAGIPTCGLVIGPRGRALMIRGITAMAPAFHPDRATPESSDSNTRTTGQGWSVSADRFLFPAPERRASPPFFRFGGTHVRHHRDAPRPGTAHRPHHAELAGSRRLAPMSQRLLAGIVTAVIAAIMTLTCGFAALIGGATGGACALPAVPGDRQALAGFAYDGEQVANAHAIIGTGAGLDVPVSGWIIAVAVALQESGLRALEHGDLSGPDSRGLFQQRAAWGPLRERMDPAGSARLFYTGGHAGQPGLLDIPGWQDLPLAQAANAVQHSAHPGAYAGHEHEATALVTTLATQDGPGRAKPRGRGGKGGCLDEGDGLAPAADAGLPAGYTLPQRTPKAVAVAVTWALAQRGTPYSYGGDCTAAHGNLAAHHCDCSSLLQMAYRAAGVHLPRTTLEQVHAGTPVPDQSQLRPGDLVFIPGSHGSIDSPRHVGMYLGHGLIVHAPKTGDVVKVAALSTWSPIASIRRVVER